MTKSSEDIMKVLHLRPRMEEDLVELNELLQEATRRRDNLASALAVLERVSDVFDGVPLSELWNGDLSRVEIQFVGCESDRSAIAEKSGKEWTVKVFRSPGDIYKIKQRPDKESAMVFAKLWVAQGRLMG